MTEPTNFADSGEAVVHVCTGWLAASADREQNILLGLQSGQLVSKIAFSGFDKVACRTNGNFNRGNLWGPLKSK